MGKGYRHEDQRREDATSYGQPTEWLPIKTGEGTVIDSVDLLCLVGFIFGDRPGVREHVQALGDRYERKKWMLYHLRDAGFTLQVVCVLHQVNHRILLPCISIDTDRSALSG